MQGVSSLGSVTWVLLAPLVDSRLILAKASLVLLQLPRTSPVPPGLREMLAPAAQVPVPAVPFSPAPSSHQPQVPSKAQPLYCPVTPLGMQEYQHLPEGRVPVLGACYLRSFLSATYPAAVSMPLSQPIIRLGVLLAWFSFKTSK